MKRPFAEDRARATSWPAGSLRITIVASYGRTQVSPTRWTGHVGPISTRPRMPESGWWAGGAPVGSVADTLAPHPSRNTATPNTNATAPRPRLRARMNPIINATTEMRNNHHAANGHRCGVQPPMRHSPPNPVFSRRWLVLVSTGHPPRVTRTGVIRQRSPSHAALLSYLPEHVPRGGPHLVRADRTFASQRPKG